MPTIPRGVIVLFTISAIALVAMVASDFLRPTSPQERLQELRKQLAEQRAAADSCRTALTREEADLRTLDARLDSLKQRIGLYESLDPDGVPADRYDLYIEAFNSYNRGIPDRNAAAERLQAHWRACREIADQHNATADSARRLATELELLRDPEKIEADP